MPRTAQPDALSVSELRQRKTQLENRLADGWAKINEAELQGWDVAAWTDFWESLLHEYEDICDDLNRVAHG